MKSILALSLMIVMNVAEAQSTRAFSEKTLSNGLQIIYLEDKSLPYISLGLLVKAGTAADPEGKKGLSYFVANLLEKGTKKKSAPQIADSFGQIASDFAANVDTDYVYFSAGGLSLNKRQVLDLFSDLILNPVFQQAEVDRLKSQVQSQLKQLPERPGPFSDKLFQSFLYASHPYSVTGIGKEKDVEMIGRSDILRHYFRFYRPNNSIITIVGQFPPSFINEVEAAFQKWNKHESKFEVQNHFPKIQGVNIRVVNRADLNQAQIRIGHGGIARTNPDFMALNIANTILGVGFSSRLMDQIRDNLGLTYGINSTFEVRKDTGSFEVSTFTRNEKVGETIKKTMEILSKFRSSGVSDKEVEAAKGYLVGVFPKTIETAEQFAARLVGLRFFGIPDSYLKNFTQEVQKVSRDDVNKAIEKHMTPDDLKILIYTNKSTLGDQLKSFESIDYKEYQDLM